MSTPYSSPGQNAPAKFFGTDISALWRDCQSAWQGMLEWPVLAWLWPPSSVCLYVGTDRRALCTHLDSPAIDDPNRAASAKLSAVLLPEEMLLRRILDLPALQRDEEAAAMALEAQTLSPFPPGDTVWLHEILYTEGSQRQASLLICSRNMVERYVATNHPPLALASPQVWVTRHNAPGYSVLPGFGANPRSQQGFATRWGRAALTLLATILLAVIAVTPTAQLYIRNAQAQQAQQALQKQASATMADRESLMQASEMLIQLRQQIGTPTPPLDILKQITDALPDDTFLANVQIQGNKVSISGQTPNASSLMKSLGSTPGLREVKAPSPALKPLGAPREIFNIEFTVDPSPHRTTP